MGYFDDIENNNWKSFEVSDDYRWVLVVVFLQVLHYLWCLCAIAGRRRKKQFTKEFMDKHFKEEHEAAFPGSELDKYGYPDTASGRYTFAAGYEFWFNFNVDQRLAMNWMENVTQVLFMQLIAGLRFPMVTAILGGVYLLGRLLFSIGYLMGGPKGRMIGAPIMMIM